MDSKEKAVDMMRHIAAAHHLGAREIAGIFGIPFNQNGPTPGPSKPPEWVKGFLRDVVGVPEDALEAASITEAEGGFTVEISGGRTPEDSAEQEREEAAEAKTKTVAALRAEMESLIDYARERFTSGPKGSHAAGFNPECLSSLMMAYRSAIELASWGEDEAPSAEE